MHKKRIVIKSEFKATAEIDLQKLDRSSYVSGCGSDGEVENALAKGIEDGEITVRGVLEVIGVVGTIDPYYEARCEIEVQKECPVHPGHWGIYDGRCIRCLNESRNGDSGKAGK